MKKLDFLGISLIKTLYYSVQWAFWVIWVYRFASIRLLRQGHDK